MLKKSLTILSISVAFYAYSQESSVIRNSVDVYSNPMLQGSSKFNSMAGSMGALGGDVSTLNTNPAGLGVAIASDISATISINKTSNTGTFGEGRIKNQWNDSNLGQSGGIAVFETSKLSKWKFISVGVNYASKTIDETISTPGNDNIALNLKNGDYITLNSHNFGRVGNLSKMSIGLGGNYDNRVYVGAGVNIHNSSLRQTNDASMRFASKSTSENFHKQYTPYVEDSKGFSASVGVIGKINNYFRVGAAIETPTWWQMDRTYYFYGYDSNQDGEYSEPRTIATPTKATLSAAYVPNKNLAVNIDYSIGLTKPKFGDMSSTAQTEMDSFINSHYRSISEVRLGVEYRIQQFRLRGGYGYASSPFGDITMPTVNSFGQLGNQSLSNLYAGSRQTLGLGLGYDFRTFYVDAAYNYISNSFKIPFLIGSPNGTEYYGRTAFFANSNAVISQAKNTFDNFTFTIGWKF